LLPQLEQAGVSPARVAAAAAHLARAREALDGATAEFLAAHVRFGSSGLSLIDGAALGRLHPEIGLRVLSAVLMRVSGATYRPRFERLNRLFSALRAGDFPARTLQGCRIGKAPKAHAGFGPSTLEIQAEKPRRSATPKAKRRKVTKPAPKPPHKKRNLGLSLNS
jgi:tRNA(Ile)-lysidine synthase